VARLTSNVENCELLQLERKRERDGDRVSDTLKRPEIITYLRSKNLDKSLINIKTSTYSRPQGYITTLDAPFFSEDQNAVHLEEERHFLGK
jgi:hypothetical protein